MEEELSRDHSSGKCDDDEIRVELEKTGNEEDTVKDPNEEDKVEDPKVGMQFNSTDDIYRYYSRYGKEKGFSVFKRNLKRGSNGECKYVTYACSHAGKPRIKTRNVVKLRPQTKLECKAALNAVLASNGMWMLSSLVLNHNHEMSPSKSRFFKSCKVLEPHVKRKFEISDMAGIPLNNYCNSSVVQAEGHENLSEKVGRLRLGKGDANAMLSYFQNMQADNSKFYYEMDLDEKGQLRNVFWADARSRAAFKEFGDVVTFDTTYLVNGYGMPFASFVGVNHHGQYILFGCGLISHEDTETFTWLFKSWLACMSNDTPDAIITDQDREMKKAIEIVFPNARHRWCLCHILKKVPEKLRGYKDYEAIRFHIDCAVYDSVTVEEFEENWGSFIKKYELETNEWLLGLYEERHRWVPAFVKDIFWAGMSTTQRSEKMNSFFDEYINSKTTLKQFVEQYESALAKKVENENGAEFQSFHSYIPCFSQYELEEQFQGAYTIAKFKEIQNELLGKIYCNLHLSKEGDSFSEYEVKEDVLFGETKRRVTFRVCFKENGSEANCSCRLLESRGILCRHCMMVFHEKGIGRVPEKYILKRWRKNVKRCHTKVRISYDKSCFKPEAHRFDNMCNEFSELAELAQDYEERCEKVLASIRGLKREFTEVEVVCGTDKSVGTSIQNDTISCRNDHAISKVSTTIADPLVVHQKGRPPSKRKQRTSEEAGQKKNGGKKKTKTTIIEDKVDGDENVGTQSTVDLNEISTQSSQHVGRANPFQSSAIQNMHPYQSSLLPQGNISFQPNMPRGYYYPCQSSIHLGMQPLQGQYHSTPSWGTGFTNMPKTMGPSQVQQSPRF